MAVGLVSGNLSIDMPQNLQTSGSPSFVDLTLSGLTASSALYLDASKKIASRALTNGQLLIGSTGAAPVAAALTGTTNQVTVALGAGSVTLSTPQDIATTSSPSFKTLSTTGGPSFFPMPRAAAYNASSTIATADLLGGWLESSANAGITLTFPTGAVLDAAVAAIATLYVTMSFKFLLWNFNSNTVTFSFPTGIAAQIMGTTIAGSTAKQYVLTRSGTASWVLYNLS